MFFKRHFKFLREVLLYTLTAFGGPQGHYGMMLKTFVHKRKDLNENELIELNSLCQLLPGASSTQLLTLIGFKRGGIHLALFTFLIWIFPACFLMCLFSFFIISSHHQDIHNSIFRFIQPMAIGFLIYTTIKSYTQTIKNKITLVIMLSGILLMLFFFKTPWVLPLLIISAGIATNFSNKRIPSNPFFISKPIRWNNIWIFVSVFVIAGIISESARSHQWEHRKVYNVFENCYRFGSFVFGGGDVLLPMMLDQYVERPTRNRIIQKNPGIIKIDKGSLLTGYGLVKAIPGPVFSFASYVGGLALKDEGFIFQILGSLVASIAIFLPSVLLVLFFFPVWNNLKNYVIVYRALEGINAVVVGVIAASAIYLLRFIYFPESYFMSAINIIIILTTFSILFFTKLPPPLLVLICLFLGWIF